MHTTRSSTPARRWMLALGAATLGVASLLAACGGGADRTKAQVRLVNASTGYATLDLRVDDQLRQGGVSYGNSANYVEVEPGKINTITRSGSSTALLTFTPSVSERKHYTQLAYGSEGQLRQLQLDDDTGAPDINRTLLRVVNTAADAGNVDVYLTGSEETIPASVPVLANAAVGTPSSYLTLTSASYRLRVTAANSKTDLRLDIPALALASRQVATLVLVPGQGGVLLSALLLTQQGSITRLDATQARMRVVAGVGNNGSVTATVAGTPLMVQVNAPAVGTYTLLPAGTQPVVVSVNGSAVNVEAPTLLAGADYTLLVHGPAAAARTSLLQDVNTIPVDGTQARIRLVNGLADLVAPLTLTVDFAPLATGVLPGAASPYATVTATTTADLAVTTAGLPTLYSEVDRVLLAGATYTVFVVGNNATATGILRRDR